MQYLGIMGCVPCRSIVYKVKWKIQVEYWKWKDLATTMLARDSDENKFWGGTSVSKVQPKSEDI